MYIVVEFYDQVFCGAVKVNNEIFDPVLPPEFFAMQLTVAQ